MVTHRSVSQVNQYNKCAYSYYLERIKRERSRPAAWLAQGTAFHEVAEAWEKSDRKLALWELRQLFSDAYDKAIGELAEKTPDFNQWFPSGRYRGPQDIPRRYEIGLNEQLPRLVDYYEDYPEQRPLLTKDGPAVELGFDMDLDGVNVKGYIDLVMLDNETGEVIVRDIKTGNKPGDDFQLATYKVAVEKEYNVTVHYGDYWMARTGKPTKPYTLSEWPESRVAEVFGEVNEGILAERFDPSPSASNCMFCSVKSSCEFSLDK